MKKLRIGILSTANIGRKNWKAIFHSGNCVVSAVASRDLNKSRGFVRVCQSEARFAVEPAVFGSYGELLASPDVDAVYIPVPTGLRKEWVIRAAEAGKHVVCEKPCAVNMADLREMLAACRKNRVQFMDGVMFMHSPRLTLVRKFLNDHKSIGTVRRISSTFSFYVGGDFFRDNIRVDGRLEPAGCLGDLGWYCIRFALWTMNWKTPRAVTGRILSQSKNLKGRPSAPTEFSAELTFDGNVTAGFYCSFVTSFQEWVHVTGQNGWLLLPDFVHPFDSYRPAFEVNRREMRITGGPKCPSGVDPMAQGHPTAQDTRMFRNFANQVRSGKLNNDWPMWALKTQQVLDACLEAARKERSVKL
ncbi:MAG TPA: Gfo/Idh/MocA family oxidoreductase [Verrucomicrobiae bacterium]|nr:Gfo/Idh/MocA family oxidoreductase [Verrucomicrobiae bacterium]